MKHGEGEKNAQEQGLTDPAYSGFHLEELDGGDSFNHAIGLRLRAVREESRRTTEHIAVLARHVGLAWHRTTVGQIERGKRSLSASELFCLPMIYWEPLDRLLPPGVTWLTDSLAVEYQTLVESFTGQNWVNGEACSGQGRVHLEPPADESSDLGPMFRDWFERATSASKWPEATPTEYYAMPPDEAEIKAAKRLDTTTHYVAYAARQLWGRSLTAERDARLADRPNAPETPRAVQAARGHITRALLAELEPAIRAQAREAGTNGIEEATEGGN